MEAEKQRKYPAEKAAGFLYGTYFVMECRRIMVRTLGMFQTLENSLRIRSFKMFSLFPEQFGKPDKTFCTGRHKSFL